MAFDLRRALLAKEEAESARLEDFAFRQRVRAWRRTAAALGLDADAVVRRTARAADAVVIAQLTEETGVDVAAVLARCRDEARRELVAEQGDPAPFRLG